MPGVSNNKFIVDWEHCPGNLRHGLAEVRKEFPWRFPERGGEPLRFEFDDDLKSGGLVVIRQEGWITIRYGRVIDAFRALGCVMGGAGTPTLRETPRFETLGVMWDVSRNGVLRPKAVQSLLLHCALMGINAMTLYAEDVYEVAGEPFFGYARGRYTARELRHLDAYASFFGVEMFPCIQTLAHLEQVLKWPDYREMVDVPGVLMAGEKSTYQLLGKMMRAASEPFRSRRIHIGMDEAHGLSLGRYRERHGVREPFDVFSEHLGRVRGLCGELGLKPMMWCDMFFRMASRNHDYYDETFRFSRAMRQKIPKDGPLVYWDYYHTTEDYYRKTIRRHRRLGVEPVVAGGLWTWQRFWAQQPFAVLSTDACMKACKAEKVKEVFMTAWGDDGAECDPFSALGGLQYFAEHGYADAVDPRRLRSNFRGASGADYEAWSIAGNLDCVRPSKAGDSPPLSITKGLLWDDPLLGLMDGYRNVIPSPDRYADIAKALILASKQRVPHMRRLRFPADLANAVALKHRFRCDVMEAYRRSDRRRVRLLMRRDLPLVSRSVRVLWAAHRTLWAATYKPFGFEVLEGRYGALLARLNHLERRLKDYVTGKAKTIPEFEVRHPLQQVKFKLGYHPDIAYGRIATASSVR